MDRIRGLFYLDNESGELRISGRFDSDGVAITILEGGWMGCFHKVLNDKEAITLHDLLTQYLNKKSIKPHPSQEAPTHPEPFVAYYEPKVEAMATMLTDPGPSIHLPTTGISLDGGKTIHSKSVDPEPDGIKEQVGF